MKNQEVIYCGKKYSVKKQETRIYNNQSVIFLLLKASKDMWVNKKYIISLNN